MKPCSVSGCEKQSRSGGMCYMHYMRVRRRGSANPPKWRADRGEPESFLWMAVESATNDCILWPFSLHDFGYGQINWYGKTHRVHALVCELVYGKRPLPKYESAHSCGKRPCVNPRHLSWKSRSDNQMDRVPHGTSNRGQRQWNHVLSDQDVREIRILLETTDLSQSAIGKRYGVAPKTISDIHTRKTWYWLTHDSLVLT